MRAVIFGAALLASIVFLAGAPTALAQQYGGAPGVYGSYGAQANGYAVPYGGSYPGSYGAYGGNYGAYGSTYGGAYSSASPYAAVCAALAYSGTTQGYAAVAASPYAATCAYLGLTGGAPGAGFASLYGTSYPGTYSGLGAYGLSSGYPYSGQVPYYGASGSPYTGPYATNSYGVSSYGSYPSYWPSSTP